MSKGWEASVRVPRVSEILIRYSNPKDARVYASREVLAVHFTYAYTNACLLAAMGIDNTLAIQVPAKDPKKPDDKPDQDVKPKPGEKEKDGEDLVCAALFSVTCPVCSLGAVTRGSGAQE